MAANFGDFFPPEFQAEHRERSIRPGAVFRVYVTSTTPPKIKRIVILGINDGQALIGHLFINSNINLHFLNSDELRNLQIELNSAGRDYLEHTSYLDCSDLHKLSLEDLRQNYEQDSQILLGHMSAEDLTQALEKVRGARTIPPKIKRLFDLT